MYELIQNTEKLEMNINFRLRPRICMYVKYMLSIIMHAFTLMFDE